MGSYRTIEKTYVKFNQMETGYLSNITIFLSIDQMPVLAYQTGVDYVSVYIMVPTLSTYCIHSM